MRSVLRQGHVLTLYCYGRVEGVPEGVEVADAAAILPGNAILRHRSGSPALFANRFRYELQRRNLGTWVDCDVYLVAPLDGERPYLFGEEAPGLLNTAVLRLPPDTPLLPRLLALFDERTVPRWLPALAKPAAYWRLAVSGRVGLAKMPWGTAGPHALTALVREYRLAKYAQPRDVFFPVHWRNAGWIQNPFTRLEDIITPRTIGVHLWNECIRTFKDAPAKDGSFLHRLQQEGR